MSMDSHLLELRKKHQSLADAVLSAQRQPAVDELQISRMKREKLRLKEEISRLSH